MYVHFPYISFFIVIVFFETILQICFGTKNLNEYLNLQRIQKTNLVLVTYFGPNLHVFKTINRYFFY